MSKIAVSKVFDKTVRPNVKALRAHVDAGGDCKDIVLNGLCGVGNGQIIEDSPFLHPSLKALYFYCCQNDINWKYLIDIDTEIARCYGSEVTKSALLNIFKRNINPNVKNILAKLDAGGDPKDVVLNELAGIGNGEQSLFGFLLFLFHKAHHSLSMPFYNKSTQADIDFVIEMARYFGSDCNKQAMSNVMNRNVKSDVKKLNDTLTAGKDPKDIGFSEFTWGGGKGIYCTITSSSLKHAAHSTNTLLIVEFPLKQALVDPSQNSQSTLGVIPPAVVCPSTSPATSPPMLSSYENASQMEMIPRICFQKTLK